VVRIQVPWKDIKIPKTCGICNFSAYLPFEDMVFCAKEHCERYQKSLKSTRPKKYPPQDIAWKPMEIVCDEEPEDIGVNIGNLNINDTRVEQDETTAGERYSKPVGDRVFLKFTQRLERAPEQILR
jgi:hypothetical protein